jgi:hypothetical protein
MGPSPGEARNAAGDPLWSDGVFESADYGPMDYLRAPTRSAGKVPSGDTVRESIRKQSKVTTIAPKAFALLYNL